MSSKLGVRQNKEFLDYDLVKFLDEKRQSESNADQLSILAVFETILPEIYKDYVDKLEQRDTKEEIEFGDFVEGVTAEDGSFYLRYFLPCCIFYIYQEWLKQTGLEEMNIFSELFNLGSGSCTMNLIPEVHGICTDCAPNLGVEFSFMNHFEIMKFNEIIFRKQRENSFRLPTIDDEGWDDEESNNDNVDCNPFESEDDSETHAGYFCNPFESSDSESDEVINLYACDFCTQSFPAEEFVQLHMKIFHSTKKVTPLFVDEGEDLMVSLVEDHETSALATADSAEVCESSTSSHRVSKYTLRNRLKF